MDEKEKPFDVVSIVLLLILAVANDAAEIIFDLLAFTGIGLVGEVVMEPVNLVMDAVFTTWFFIKCGFGGPSIMQLVDDLLELVGIPGRTICVLGGILIANNPKLAQVAEVAGAAVVTGGAGAVAAETGEAAEVGAVAAEGATAAEGAATTGGATAEVKSAEGQVGETTKEVGGGEGEQKKAAEERFEKEMETEEEKAPEEVAKEKIFEQTQQMPEQKEEEEGKNEVGGAVDSNVVSGDEFRKRAEEIAQRQKKLPKIIDLSENNEDDQQAAA